MALLGQALYGAWLYGSVLGTVTMGLHHKHCHTLGGTLNLLHAETHAVMEWFAAFAARARPA